MHRTCLFSTSAYIAVWLPISYSGSKWLPDFETKAVDLAVNRNGTVLVLEERFVQ